MPAPARRRTSPCRRLAREAALKVSRSTRSAGLCRLLRHHLVYGAGREVETHAGNAIEVGSSHAEHFAHRAGGDLLMTGWRLHGPHTQE
jgi:hypothetical protein